MSFLFPLGLLGLVSIPALIWLWRLAASRHHVRVPSLAPFEHLLQRPPSRRRRLNVNWLFWLQLAALALAALALADPAVPSRRSSTTLVLLDTSASMQAALPNSPSPMRQALDALARRLARLGPDERLFVVTTAPVRALTVSPVADPSELAPQVARVDRADLGGTLAAALHVARALLGFLPDRTVVLSDEPQPPRLAEDITWETFGAPAPNAAIVGVETTRSLCRAQEGHVIVTVQNIAAASQELTVRLERDGRRLTDTTRRLEPFERVSLTLQVEPELDGWAVVHVEAAENALAADDRVWVRLHGHARVPVRVVSSDPAFTQTLSRWLEACPGVVQDTDAGEGDGQAPAGEETLVITDQPEIEPEGASRLLVFHRGAADHRVVLAHWLPDASHPISRYLEPLERAATALTSEAANGRASSDARHFLGRQPSGRRHFLAGEDNAGSVASEDGAGSVGRWGDPVLWGLVRGERLPLVMVRESGAHARRIVHMFIDPAATPSSPPLVVTVLNSLGWLAGSRGAGMTGEPLSAGPFEDGPVRVRRPDGRSQDARARGGRLRYDDTDRAGLYRLTQGARTIEEAANFIDPIESDTMRRASSWVDDRERLSAPPPAPERRALSTRLLWAVLALLLIEWFVYIRRRRARGTGG